MRVQNTKEIPIIVGVTIENTDHEKLYKLTIQRKEGADAKPAREMVIHEDELDVLQSVLGRVMANIAMAKNTPRWT